MRSFVFITLSLLFFSSKAQNVVNYNLADSIALSHSGKQFKSTEDLATTLTKGVKNREMQFRIVFRWITDNIAYDPSARGDDPEKALKKGEGVCAGYAHLLSKTCGHLGINCMVVTGVAKCHNSVGSDLNDPKYQHAWNAVELDGEWKLVDATWAAGYYDRAEKRFDKEFKEEFYFSDPEVFAERHLPKDKQWQFLEHPRHKGEFTHSPLFYATKHHCYVELEQKNCTIRVKENQEVVIRFTSSCKDSDDPSASHPDPETKYQYEYRYDARRFIEDPVLTVFFNGEPLVSYRIIVKPVAQKS